MIGLEDRQVCAQDIDVAHKAGARLRLACETTGINVRTLQRWKAQEGLLTGDRRPSAAHPAPEHALSLTERAEVLRVANEPRFAAVPPARIVPMLADEGVYLASESTFARVLRQHGQTAHRGRAKAPRATRPPTTHVASAPSQVWCWDMTYLPAIVLGRWFYLYLILDLFSRKIVGWEVHDTDDSNHAAHLARRTALSEEIALLAAKPLLHGDNGSTLKATTVLAMLNWLGIEPSYSRPRVSDDNAYAEALSPQSTVQSFLQVASRASTLHGRGLPPSSSGTTSNIDTAASATSPRSSVTPAPITRSSRLAMPCTPVPARANQPAGRDALETGLRSAPSPSTQNETR